MVAAQRRTARSRGTADSQPTNTTSTNNNPPRTRSNEHNTHIISANNNTSQHRSNHGSTAKDSPNTSSQRRRLQRYQYANNVGRMPGHNANLNISLLELQPNNPSSYWRGGDPTPTRRWHPRTLPPTHSQLSTSSTAARRRPPPTHLPQQLRTHRDRSRRIPTGQPRPNAHYTNPPHARNYPAANTTSHTTLRYHKPHHATPQLHFISQPSTPKHADTNSTQHFHTKCHTRDNSPTDKTQNHTSSVTPETSHPQTQRKIHTTYPVRCLPKWEQHRFAKTLAPQRRKNTRSSMSHYT